MTRETLTQLALKFRILVPAAFLIFAAATCSEKCNAFWPCDMVPEPHVDPTFIDDTPTYTDKDGNEYKIGAVSK